MPILRAPQQETFVDLPLRRVRLAATTDVLVVGGGPAGIGAAVSASRLGAGVILTERYGFLGGNATAALVMPFMSFYIQRKNPGGGRGKSGPLKEAVVTGVWQEFLQKLILAKGALRALPAGKMTRWEVPFDPEIFKGIALDMVDESGARILFHAFSTAVCVENSRVKYAVFATKSGLIAIGASVIIDSTGDGDIACQAGEEYDLGRPLDGLTQPMTLMFRMGEFSPSRFQSYVKKHPGQWKEGVYGLWDLIQKAEKDGRLKLPRENILFFSTPHPKEVSVNSTRVCGLKGNDVWDLSLAEWLGRRQMRQIVSFLRDYVPGFRESYPIQSGVQVGVRETRRVRGLYTLTQEDILSARKFPDSIARGAYPIDIHNPKGRGTLLKPLPPGEFYEIPLRCLIPKKNKGLLMAGRCISGTHEAHASYRIMAVSMATGQAAGVCAALAVKNKVSPEMIPARAVRLELRKQGADPGPTPLGA
ncbi:MAG: FAD-dependent oxidoreductase [Candidatus Omnitrophota bacterium]